MTKEARWKIHGYESTTLVFNKELPGGYSVSEIKTLLQRLACRDLTVEEIFNASSRRARKDGALACQVIPPSTGAENHNLARQRYRQLHRRLLEGGRASLDPLRPVVIVTDDQSIRSRRNVLIPEILRAYRCAGQYTEGRLHYRDCEQCTRPSANEHHAVPPEWWWRNYGDSALNSSIRD
jgi:hypothetical protein